MSRRPLRFLAIVLVALTLSYRCLAARDVPTIDPSYVSLPSGNLSALVAKKDNNLEDLFSLTWSACLEGRTLDVLNALDND